MAVNTVIATNVLALNTNRTLGCVSKNKQKNMNRLSSGKRVNTASDDAASLTISEKMKSQIRGLNMADRNTEDAISLLETTESLYSEVQDMFQRCREVIIQSNTDTITDDDRKKLILEVKELIIESEEIIERTTYNGKNLSELKNNIMQIGSNNGQYIELFDNKILDVKIFDKDLSEKMINELKEIVIPSIKKLEDVQKEGLGSHIKGLGSNGKSDMQVADIATHLKVIDDVLKGIDVKRFPNLRDKVQTLEQEIEKHVKNAVEDTNKYFESVTKDIKDGQAKFTVTHKGEEAILSKDDNWFASGHIDLDKLKEVFNDSSKVLIKRFSLEGLSRALDSSVNEFIEELEINAESLFKFDIKEHIEDYLEGKIEFNNEIHEQYLNTFNAKISSISSERGKLGSVINRLEYTSNSLKVSEENLEAANSRIEDADMAREMMSLTSNEILIQSSILLLSQANSSKESIMKLLE